MRRIRDWSIRTRLLLAFLGALIPYLTLAVIGTVGFRVLSQRVELIQVEVLEELEAVAHLRVALVQVVMPANDYLITGDPRERMEFEQRLSKLREGLSRAETTLFGHPEERRLLEEVKGRVPKIEALSREILASRDPLRNRTARVKMAALDQLSDEAAEALSQIHKIAHTKIQEEIERGRGVIRWVTAAGLATFILGVAGAVAFALLFSIWLSRPILAIAEKSRRIADGDLLQRVEVHAGAELGEVAQAFNAMASQVAEARSGLEEQIAELAALTETGRLLTGTLELSEVLGRLIELARTRLGADVVGIWLREEPSGLARLYAEVGAGARPQEYRMRFRPGQGLVGWIMEHREPLVLADCLTDPRLFNRDSVEAEGLHSFLGVPILLEDVVVGVLVCLRRERREFAQAELALAHLFVLPAAVAIRNARLYEESRRTAAALAEQNRQRQLLHEAQRALIAKYDLASLLQHLVGTAAELIGAGYGALAVLGGDGKVTQLHTTGIDAETREQIGSLPEGRGLLGVVFRGNELLRLEDLTADPRAAGFPPHHPPMRRLLAAPIRLKDRILGAIYLADKDESFTPEDEDILTALCADAAVAIENARLVQELNQALETLESTQQQLVRSEPLRAVGVLASRAAHHLNDLLTVIVGRVQLLQAKIQEPELRRMLEMVERSARESADVVRRMLTFSRRQRVLQPVAVDLNGLVKEVLELARPLWQDDALLQGIQIETCCELGEIPLVRGDPVSLREVLWNVLLNAIEALPEGGTITVRTGASDGRVQCSVANTGVGRSDEVRARALDPFFTTKGPKRTGLGLSVSCAILQRHEGELTIESTHGAGTTVTIHLPVMPATPLEPAMPAASGVPALPLRILLIEDDIEVRETLAEMLAADGHVVIHAARGQEGVARLEAGDQVDLVLTDLGMPGITGWDVVRAVKAHWRDLPIGVITGWWWSAEAMQKQPSGVDFVIPKPVTLDTLQKEIARCLSRRRAQPAGGSS